MGLRLNQMNKIYNLFIYDFFSTIYLMELYNYHDIGNVFTTSLQFGGDLAIPSTIAAEIQSYRNPEWPPVINKAVDIKDSEGNIYTGIYIGNLWNNTAGVVELATPENYTDNSLLKFKQYNYGVNHFLLLPTYYWSYNNSESSTIKDNINKSLEHQEQIYNINENIRPKQSMNNKLLLTKPIKQNNESKDNIYIGVPNVKQTFNTNSNVNFVPTQQVIVQVDKKNKINNKIINRFYNFNTNLQNITDDMIIDANNPYYKPTLSSSSVDFSGEDIYIDDDSFGSGIISISGTYINLLMEKLKSFELPKKEDIKVSVNRNIAINAIIIDPEDELNEGNRIIKYLKRMLNHQDNNIFNDIIYKIHEGYVFITRKGAMVQDIVTEELVGQSLDYFGWQLGRPIDYHTLKYVIFQNEYQKSIKVNIKQKDEADAILGLEYIIGIQCKSEYQLWTLKRLLMIWYADGELEQIIRKIKVLINHYRADASHDFNKINGVLPMLIIYPRYGLDNAKLLLSKLDYYFSLYVQDDKNDYQIYISDSTPTYFQKKTNLLYYSNGSMDLKAYIKESLDCKTKYTNDSMTVDMSKIKGTQNLI